MSDARQPGLDLTHKSKCKVCYESMALNIKRQSKKVFFFWLAMKAMKALGGIEVLLTGETLEWTAAHLDCGLVSFSHLEAKIQHSGSWWFFSIGNILRKKTKFQTPKNKAKKQTLTLHEQEGLNQIRNRQTEDPSNPIKRYWHTSGSGDIRMFRIFWSFLS